VRYRDEGAVRQRWRCGQPRQGLVGIPQARPLSGSDPLELNLVYFGMEVSKVVQPSTSR